MYNAFDENMLILEVSQVKELYTTPEAQILCFAPVESLANTPMEEYAQRIGAQNEDDSIDIEISGIEKP